MRKKRKKKTERERERENIKHFKFIIVYSVTYQLKFVFSRK